ncbi:unnamed protein product [Orchesella dallaii]|uniref:Outer dense fiber protein 3 n=1 Tax=Orchesella dallaii TaxID=48710 RepID=A0ABP1RXJ4_9HEXA
MGRNSTDRRAGLQMMRGPGPAAVNLPPTVGYVGHDETRKRNPAYSLGLKLGSTLIQTKKSPGPIYLIPKGMTAKGPDGSPAYTLRPKTKSVDFQTTTPGPAAYYPDINCNRNKAPAFPLSFRTKVIELGKASPGPIYLLPPCLGPRIPDKCAAGEVSIKGRGKGVEKLSQSPGPIYDIGSPDIIKYKGGEVTIKGRWKDLKSQSCMAGPASYNVIESSSKVYRQPPAFSLGIRHSEFAGNYLTECDKSENAGIDDEC